MATSEEIRNKALSKLGVLAVGATASAEATQDMDNAYTEVYAGLEAIGLAFFSKDDVPEEVVNSVAAKVAMSRASEYLISERRYQRLLIEAVDAERAITAAMHGPFFGAQGVRDF